MNTHILVLLLVSFIVLPARLCAQPNVIKLPDGRIAIIDDATRERMEKNPHEWQDEMQWQKALYDQELEQNSSIINTLQLLAFNPEVLANLEIVPDQKKNIEALTKEFETEKKRIQSEAEKMFTNPLQKDAYINGQISKLKSQYSKQIADSLVRHQLVSMMDWSLDKQGLPKLLTETPIGDALELSDAKKQRIREKSNQFAKKVDDFIRETRRESLDIVFEELNDDQKAKLRQALGLQIDSLQSQEIEKVLWQYRYRDLDDQISTKKRDR